ncbi:dihydrolipoamide succinyltransferase, partial [Myxococcota bacterium]|nr:dihydrolipoamide succinyltransferase [Myxococcota bacterium]
MSVELKVPPVGESITEVALGEWLKGEGEFVHRDEPVVVVESDKVNLEVPAPISGRVVRLRKRRGEMAKIGETIAELEPAEAPATESAPTSVAAAAATPAAAATGPVMPAAARVLGEAGLPASA